MYKTTRIVAAASLCWALAAHSLSPVQADGVTGQSLFGYCKAKATTQDRVFCLGYLRAVADTLGTLKNNDATEALSCPPDKVMASDIADIYMAFVVQNPKYKHKTGSVAALDALIDAFPCGTTNKS